MVEYPEQFDEMTGPSEAMPDGAARDIISVVVDRAIADAKRVNIADDIEQLLAWVDTDAAFTLGMICNMGGGVYDFDARKVEWDAFDHADLEALARAFRRARDNWQRFGDKWTRVRGARNVTAEAFEDAITKILDDAKVQAAQDYADQVAEAVRNGH